MSTRSIKLALIALMMVLFTGTTLAHTLESQKFYTKQEAAVYALQEASIDRSYEYGGAIYENKTDHTYRITKPRTDHLEDAVHVDKKDIDNYKLIADYHTHTCTHDGFSFVFSPSDIAGYYIWNDIGYMLDECTGKVHEFIPHFDNPRRVRLYGTDGVHEGFFWMTPGAIVGHIAMKIPEAKATLLDVLVNAILIDKYYETMDEAAVDALDRSYQLNDAYEFGGIIVQNDKTHLYRVSAPTTSHEQGGVYLPWLAHFDGYTLVGSYHTHICSKHFRHQYFSDIDVDLYEGFRVTGYMADLCTGRVGIYVPDVDKRDVQFTKPISGEPAGKGANGRTVGYLMDIKSHDPTD